MPEQMLVLERVSVAYDGVPAVQEVSVTVGAGRRLALLGPSGCGKTSLLRAVAGLEPLASGEVRIDGQNMARVPTHRRGVGMMFQGHALFPHLDAAGNIAFGLRMAQWPRERMQDRVQQMLTLVGLTDRGGSRVTELSGGEQQRVALARTLAPGPGLVLLDEPLSSLDRALREDLLDEMVEAFAATGTTAVLVSHDQSEALRFGDDVAVMHAGRIVRSGTPEEVWADPQQAWTARFLGLANIVGPDHPAVAGAGESAGAYLIRPDLLRLVDHGEGLGGLVTAKAFRGGLSVLTVQLAAGGEVDVWTVGGDERVGNAVLVAVPPRAVRPLLG